MRWTSIQDAYGYWRRYQTWIEAPRSLDEAEQFILSAMPECTDDVARILDVVCANFGEVRADGLDHSALKRIRQFLAPEL